MEGDFRAGAVDADMGGGGVKLWETDPNSKIGGGLDRAVVARECIRSVDLGVRHAFMPGYVRCVVFVFFLLLRFLPSVFCQMGPSTGANSFWWTGSRMSSIGFGRV